MQLRHRLLISISLVLLVSLLAGAALSYWTALRKIDLEMTSSLAVGEGTVKDALLTLNTMPNPQGQLATLIQSFDGDRHLKASLVDGRGTPQMSSRVREPTDPPPGWLFRTLAGEPHAIRLAVPAGLMPDGQILLQADPRNEVAEVWEDAKLKFSIVSGFSAAVLALVYLMLGRALRPLENLSAALVRVGRGDYGAHVDEEGPRELATIYREFNHMAARLADAERQNRSLNSQLSTVQEEERNDIARDLHDDVGPFLFAVDVDAQTIPPLLERNELAAVADRAKSIRQAVSHMQTHLRSILNRLRPALLLDLGLAPAVDHLMAFWQARNLNVAFDVDIAQESFGAALDQVAFRVIQEAVANAIRHGKPKHIEVRAVCQANRMIITIRDDGNGVADSISKGFGLTGMRERITALGGTVTLSNRAGENGVTVSVQIPVPKPAIAASKPETHSGAVT